VQQARALAEPLNGVFARLRTVGPDARATLATARRSTPDLNALLGQITSDGPLIEKVARGAIPVADCIRPYTPDIVNLFTTWSDFMGHNDEKDHFFRMVPKVLTPTPYNANTTTSGDVMAQSPEAEYAFPIPPGHLAGQPWYQPQCGVTEDAYNASKDPESRQRYGSVGLFAPPPGTKGWVSR
jgi:hypothetical protein